MGLEHYIHIGTNFFYLSLDLYLLANYFLYNTDTLQQLARNALVSI